MPEIHLKGDKERDDIEAHEARHRPGAEHHEGDRGGDGGEADQRHHDSEGVAVERAMRRDRGVEHRPLGQSRSLIIRCGGRALAEVHGVIITPR